MDNKKEEQEVPQPLRYPGIFDLTEEEALSQEFFNSANEIWQTDLIRKETENK